MPASLLAARSADVAAEPARPGPLAGRSGAPADGPRRGQPLLADATSAPAWSRRSRTSASQGEWPSHPELLDWLATEFVRTGWDVKALQRLIVTSGDLPPVVARDAGAAAARPGEPPAGPRAAAPAVGRDDPRPGAGGQRPARRANRRAVGQAVSAGRAVEAS